MAGQIIKRGEKIWLVRIFLGRDANGKRDYFNKTIHGTKTQAQKYLTAKLREKDLGVFIEPALTSLDEYLDKWLETVAKGRVREKTYIGYEEILRLHIRPKLGAKRLCDIKAMDIQKTYSDMQAKGLSAQTVKHAHKVLTSSLKQAVKWNMLSQNPASYIELPRIAKKEMVALSADEAKNFLTAAKTDKWYALFLFALETGMRPEEYLALKWSDIDFSKGIATVRRVAVWIKHKGWKFDEPKTSKSRRSIPLSESLLSALKQHRAKQGEYILQQGENYKRLDLVFAGKPGTVLDRNSFVNRHFKKVLVKANLPKTIRLYDLRHTCATLLLLSGENPKVVSERLGHSSVVITLETYSHVLPNMQQTATDKLSKMLHAGNE